VGVTKQLVYGSLGETDRTAAFARETKIIWWIGEQADAIEGVMSFMERRAPAWTVPKGLELPEELRG
jgi:enoyl-CoA hydratase/carnithine racemase